VDVCGKGSIRVSPVAAARRQAKEDTMPKLTDTQLVILSEAAKREDGSLLPPPNKLKLASEAVAATVRGLIKKKLAAAAPAAPGAAVWRDDNGEPMMLVITDAGLEAIGVTPNDAAPIHGAKARPAAKSSRKAGRQKMGESSPRKGRRAASHKEADGSVKSVRSGSKQAKVIDLLRRPQGASIEEMMKATGWQAHSVRGVMSGALKKKLGLTIASAKEKRGRVYRIVGSGKQRAA
jgi:hypothetical protein